MNSSNLFILGLLLLTANLSLAAIFSPAHAGRAEANRLLLTAKLALLASIQIGAWAIVLHQGGAAPTLIETFTRCAACFTFISGATEALLPPWGETAAFISLNGLLFIPVALLPWMRGPSRSQKDELNPPIPQEVPATSQRNPPESEKASPESGAPESHSATHAPSNPPPSVRTDIPSPSEIKQSTARIKQTGSAEPAHQTQTSNEFERGGFRPKIPKALSPNAPLSPEQELAEQMKPVGPTPPPIRFEWKN